MTSTLYFAYGSNLNRADWLQFCRDKGFEESGLRPREMAFLPDEALTFNYRSRGRGGGALSITPRRGAVVEGYLFDVSPEGWAALDRKEGHPKFYRREPVTVLDAGGHEIKALTYRTTPAMATGFVAPTADYLAICHAGREAFGLSTAELDSAAASETPAACDAVFVYGTLMRGEARASAWADAELGCALLATAPGQLLDHGAYPGLAPGAGPGARGMVKGDFLRFNAIGDILTRFDAIEGFEGFGRDGNLFRRSLVYVDVGRGRIRLAWTYLTTQCSAPLIAAGDWRAHRNTRQLACAKILAGHRGDTADFPSRLAQVPDGPFGTQYSETPTYDRVLEDLVAGRIDERSLAQASGKWDVRWG